MTAATTDTLKLAASSPADNQRADSGMTNVLKKLGVMTSLRDTYLVEQSLLRTLGPLLGVLETSFYRMDGNRGLISALHHSRRAALSEGGAQSFVENFEEVSNAPSVSDDLHNLIDTVRLLGKPCSRKQQEYLLMCYPIFGNGEQVGYFVFRRDHEVSPAEDALIQGILEVFTNYFALLDTSQRDPLTGLLNRHSLESNLDRLWNVPSARRHDARNRIQSNDSFWLCVIDIDFFKKINDTFGHIMGDEVLIMVTRLLQSAFRKTDLLYRYGGEEFIAIIGARDLSAARQTFERARSKVEAFNFPQVGHVTISGGFAMADPGVLPQEIIHRADSSLYVAKGEGRNRIYYYSDLLERGALKEAATGSIDLF
jgi:diguanylate cyclase (GGDEF)-like protein